MAFLKTRSEELDLVKQAAERIAHRTHSKFVLKSELLEIVEEEQAESQPLSHQDEKAVSFT